MIKTEIRSFRSTIIVSIAPFPMPRDDNFFAWREQHWLGRESHVPAIDSKYPPGNYVRLKRAPSSSYRHHYWHHHTITPSTTPLLSHHNSHRHRRHYRSCFWHRGNTPATYEYLRQLNMHTTDNVLFLLHGRSIYDAHTRGSESVETQTRANSSPTLMIKDLLSKSDGIKQDIFPLEARDIIFFVKAYDPFKR